MIRYAVYLDATGEIVRTGDCPESNLSSMANGTTEVAVAAPAEVSGATHWRSPSGQFVAYSLEGIQAKQRPPRPGFIWSPSTESWLDNRTLEAAKDDAWQAIKARREVAFAARVISFGGVAYSITKDKSNLGDRIKSLEAAITIGAATTSTVSTWRDLDDVGHQLTITGYYALAAEMGARGQVIFERSWALDQQVQAAADKAAIAAIDFEADWP